MWDTVFTIADFFKKIRQRTRSFSVVLSKNQNTVSITLPQRGGEYTHRSMCPSVIKY